MFYKTANLTFSFRIDLFLIRKLKSGDLLVVQSLDRLGRNYEEILEQWRTLIKVKEVDIRILNMPLLDTANKTNGLIGKLVADLVLQLFSFVAESERANIKERQRQGIDAAMKRSVKFGRPKIGNAREIAERFTPTRVPLRGSACAEGDMQR